MRIPSIIRREDAVGKGASAQGKNSTAKGKIDEGGPSSESCFAALCHKDNGFDFHCPSPKEKVQAEGKKVQVKLVKKGHVGGGNSGKYVKRLRKDVATAFL